MRADRCGGRTALALSAGLLASGCLWIPLDVYPAAQRAAAQGEYLRAMALLEQVPGAHPRADEARALAKAVEARVLASQVYALAGMAAWARGDNTLAVKAIETAHQQWPSAPGLDQLLAFTRSIIVPLPAAPPAGAALPAANSLARVSIDDTDGDDRARPAEAIDLPMAPAMAIAPRAGPAEPSAAEPSAAEVPRAAPSERRAPISAAPPVAIDREALATVRALVRGRDLPLAIERLTAAQQRWPEDREVRTLLTGLLLQRALVFYGRGWLEAALEDWMRVLLLNPGDQQVSGFIETTRAELTRHRVASGKKNAGG